MSRPAKKAALKMVVANWEMPPPTSSVNLYSWSMTGAGTKPLAAVRRPTWSLTEKVAPGAMTAPRIRSAMRWMFWTRGSPAAWLVVNVPIGSVIPSLRAASSSRLGATLFRGTATAVSADARLRSADWMAVTAPGPQHPLPALEGVMETRPPLTVKPALTGSTTGSGNSSARASGASDGSTVSFSSSSVGWVRNQLRTTDAGTVAVDGP